MIGNSNDQNDDEEEEEDDDEEALDMEAYMKNKGASQTVSFDWLCGIWLDVKTNGKAFGWC